MRIRWSDPAVRDFTHICDYIEKNGGAATARRVAHYIYEGVDILAKFPESGRSVANEKHGNLCLAACPT